MASFTLKTESVDYGGGRGGMTMYNTINYTVSGNQITFSYGGRSGTNNWTLYASQSGTDYAAILEIQVDYGSGWTTLVSKSRAIPTVAQGGLDIIQASEDMIGELGTHTLSSGCEMRALYYANHTPAPTSQYPYAFPNESYAESSQTAVEVGGPSGGYISSVVPGTDSFTLTGGVTDMGLGSQTYAELLVLNAAYTQGGIPQRYEGFNALSATKTITNSSPTSAGGITISPNTLYYLGVYADNGVGSAYRYDGGTAVTTAVAPTVSVGAITDTSVAISYSTTADGGYYDKEIQYSLDGGTTWTTGATVTGGSAASGTFTISNLNSGTTYSIQTRVHTTAGDTVGTTLSATTTGSSVKLYGPAPVYSYAVTALTNNTGFDATTFMSKWEAEHGAMAKEPASISVIIPAGMTKVRLKDVDNNVTNLFLFPTGSYNNEGAEWGFANEPVNGDFTATTYVSSYQTKRVNKLYGAAYKIDTIGSYTVTHGKPTGHWLIYDGHGNPLFDAATFMPKFNETVAPAKPNWNKYGGYPTRIDAYRQSGYYSLYVSVSINGYLSSMRAVASTTSLSDFRTACADWGVAINETTYSQDEHDYITLSSVSGAFVAEKIAKLYGAVSDGNGGYETKLIYEDNN